MLRSIWSTQILANCHDVPQNHLRQLHGEIRDVPASLGPPCSLSVEDLAGLRETPLNDPKNGTNQNDPYCYIGETRGLLGG